MKAKFLTIFSALFLFSFISVVAQNNEGFIYGKVTTVDDDVYQGCIRWNDEEVFWFDMFNSEKRGNPWLDEMSREDRRALEEEHDEGFDFIFSTSWNEDFNHVFVCQFGNIKTIKILGSDDVELTFKDGTAIDLEGGSNDIGTNIYVLDEELGEIKLKWDRIDEIEFMPTPKNVKSTFGQSIFGTVYTEKGDEFRGYIQWDHDERLSGDELDGDNRDGEISVEFGKIKSIQKDGNGSLVLLEGGREFKLRGSNDVNDDNRGIIVNVSDFGRVDIPWEDFEQVVFDLDHLNNGPSYNDFQVPEYLAGTVNTDDESYSGMIIYDLDENLDFEILQGNLDDMEFMIPFRYIKSIEPKNYKFSKIELRNGKKILLGDAHDVTYDNYGILIMIDDKDYKYVPMRYVELITFR